MTVVLSAIVSLPASAGQASRIMGDQPIDVMLRRYLPVTKELATDGDDHRSVPLHQRREGRLAASVSAHAQKTG
jgi:hypothetical protein